MQAIAANYLSDTGRTAAEMQTAFENWLVFTKELQGGAAEVEYTLTTDAFTLADGTGCVSIRGQGGAADNLATITTGAGTRTGMRLRVRNGNSSEVITVKHGTGNVYLCDGRDRILADTKTYIDLYFNGTNWVEVNDNKSFLNQMPGSVSEALVTIASDLITPVSAIVKLETEGAAASDNCDGANVTTYLGNLLIIRPYNASHVVTVRHNQTVSAGFYNFTTYDGNPITLNSLAKAVVFIKDVTNTTWREILRSAAFGGSGGGGSFTPVTKTTTFSLNDAAGTLYIANTASGTFTGTFQTSPADGRLYKVWTSSAANVVTLQTTGGELFYYPDGTTATSFTLANSQGVLEFCAITGGYLLT